MRRLNLTVHVPADVKNRLVELAGQEDRPVSKMAALVLEMGLHEYENRGGGRVGAAAMLRKVGRLPRKAIRIRSGGG